MSAANYDFTIEQGSTFYVTFAWQDASGTPISLANYSAHLQIRNNVGNVLVNLTSTPAAGLTLEPTSQTGVIAVRIGADITSTITSHGTYDLKLTKTGDMTETVRLVGGQANISSQVTV